MERMLWHVAGADGPLPAVQGSGRAPEAGAVAVQPGNQSLRPLPVSWRPWQGHEHRCLC